MENIGRPPQALATVENRARKEQKAPMFVRVIGVEAGRSNNAGQSTKYIAASVPGKLARSKSIGTRYRWKARPAERLDGLQLGTAAPYDRVQGHEGANFVVEPPSWRTNALATSASPPVFAYGTNSELKIHSFNGGINRSVTNA